LVFPTSEGPPVVRHIPRSSPVADARNKSLDLKVSASHSGLHQSRSSIREDESSFKMTSRTKIFPRKLIPSAGLDYKMRPPVARESDGIEFGRLSDQFINHWELKNDPHSTRGSIVLRESSSFADSNDSFLEVKSTDEKNSFFFCPKDWSSFEGLPRVPHNKEDDNNNFLQPPAGHAHSESAWSFDDDLSESNSVDVMEEDWGEDTASVYSSTSFQNMKVEWLPSFAHHDACQWQPCNSQASRKLNVLGNEYGFCSEVCAQKLKYRLLQITSWELWLPRFEELMEEKYVEKIKYIHDKNGYTPLYFAIMYNNPILVREILQSMDETGPGILNPFGLMMACIEGYYEIVEILLEGRFPIHCASGIYPTYAQTDTIDLKEGIRLGKAEKATKLKICALVAESITRRKRELANLLREILAQHIEGPFLHRIVDVLVEYSLT